MKPKPFWPLNHFTVPIGISLLQSAYAQNSRDHHTIQFNFDDVSGRKRARRRIQQGTAANRISPKIYTFAGNTRPGRDRPVRGRDGVNAMRVRFAGFEASRPDPEAPWQDRCYAAIPWDRSQAARSARF